MSFEIENRLPSNPNSFVRSEEVDEILTEIPNWTLRWGITLIFATLLFLLFLASFLKYPDIIKGTITISSENPPINLVAQSSGVIKILVSDNTEVLENQSIAFINSTANHDDIVLLKKQIDSIKNNHISLENTSILKDFEKNYQLGEIQVAYNNFLIKLKEQSNLSIREKGNILRKESIFNQIQQLSLIESNLLKQKKILENEVQVLQKNLEVRYKPLHKAGSISTEFFEQKNNEILQKNNSIEVLNNNIAENQNKIITLRGQSVEYDFEQKDKELNTNNLAFEAFSNLSNQLETWFRKYEIKSPIHGKVNFKNFLKNNSFIQQNDEIVSIIPHQKSTKTNTLVGELFIETLGSGKVKIGQSVNISLENYPKKEFGILKGKIISIADISTDLGNNKNMIKATVSMPYSLITTSKKKLKFQNGMKGTAEVITKDLSLLERIFELLKNGIEQ